MKRRTFLLGTVTLGWSLAMSSKISAGNSTDKAQQNIAKITKSDEVWKTLLTAEQYHVLRKEGTEPPFSSPLNNEKAEGVYHCAGCDFELFTSSMKFDSGTGWPSFTTSIANHLETRVDFKIIVPRTEYHCARCGGHHGHIFSDGPEPTGQRWCNNGIALTFKPA